MLGSISVLLLSLAPASESSGGVLTGPPTPLQRHLASSCAGHLTGLKPPPSSPLVGLLTSLSGTLPVGGLCSRAHPVRTEAPA